MESTTLNSYIWKMRFLTLISLLVLLVTLLYVDPQEGIGGIILFYSALFFLLNGFFNLFFLFFRRKALGDKLMALAVGMSFRQGTLLAFLAIALIALQSFRALVWWDGLLILAGIFLIELYFLSRK